MKCPGCGEEAAFIRGTYKHEEADDFFCMRCGRKLATRCMWCGKRLLVNQDFGKMVSFRHGGITSVPIKDVIGHLNLVDTQKQYDTDRYNGRRSILNL